MDTPTVTENRKLVYPRFVKTNIPNLIKLEMSEGAASDATYYGRCKVNGKTIRESLETKDFKVAKPKLQKWLMGARGRVNANEGSMGSLIEEYKRRLQLKLNSLARTPWRRVR